MADFFRNDLSRGEQENRQNRFKFLSQRYGEQKGTLLYDSGKYLNSCYYDRFVNGTTCATTGKRIVKGEVYDSLLEYYKKMQPHLEIYPDDCVAMVSFKGIDQPQPVAAKLLHLRVMNNSLPRSLNQIDKLTPKDRSKFINYFWKDVGSDLLGRGKPHIAQYFWTPVKKRIIELLPPTLQFANQMTIPTPPRRDFKEFREYYRQRLPLLRKFGCLETSKLMENIVHFAIPIKTTQEMRGNLIKDITEHLKQLTTNKAMTPKLVRYESLDDAFLMIKKYKMPGIVVFVFDDESSETYYKVANELHNWRIKRITFRELENKFSKLESKINHGGTQLSRAEKGWNSFIEMIALDVLQQMDCVPWGFKDELPYDAHLAVDVGRDKRYYALSLLIFHPFPRIYTVVFSKPDIKRETINHIVMSEKIIDLCNNASVTNDFQPLRSVLVLRDGRESGNELRAINAAKKELITNGTFVADAVVDVVDFHKSSLKKPRFWEIIQGSRVEQIFEGTAICLDDRTAVLATTGAPTLHQGTAIPVILEARSENVDMKNVIESVYASTQLNFSSPNVSQRLSLELKRTDDELKNRDAQEIRRTR